MPVPVILPLRMLIPSELRIHIVPAMTVIPWGVGACAWLVKPILINPLLDIDNVQHPPVNTLLSSSTAPHAGDVLSCVR